MTWESSWYVSSNDAATVQRIIGIFEKLLACDNNDRSFLLVTEYFEMIYREISHEWLDQFLQEPILRGATNFHALVPGVF